MKFYWKNGEDLIDDFDAAINEFVKFFNSAHEYGVKGKVGSKEIRLFLKKDLFDELSSFQKAVIEKDVTWLRQWFPTVWLILSPRSSVLLIVPKVKENRGIFLFSRDGLFYPDPLYQKVDEETNNIFSVLYFRIGTVYMEVIRTNKVIFWYHQGGAKLEKVTFKREDLDEALIKNS